MIGDVPSVGPQAEASRTFLSIKYTGSQAPCVFEITTSTF